ncbi:hypothetical protein GLA29479_2206 [Lysobacter antibioticus]|uniref:Uncharacterized protein n=1 Tax=Lysobacter antibioticus TaxID=84531 RepID=A0A0S2DWY2_LYSAN|nr:hypothetical protein GLA29479_2206 [Lysobacter antibioticus]ALN79113.1 hypothetical protein LA76x_0951 [Lysobacter antibioticus]
MHRPISIEAVRADRYGPANTRHVSQDYAIAGNGYAAGEPAAPIYRWLS